MAIDRSGTKEAEIDFEEALVDLEHRLDRLKILYEQFFMGIEKMEPHTARKEVSRKIIEMAQRAARNTAHRYRFNALNQKYGVYVAYWNRTQRAIENGTYYRSVAKAGREALRRGLEMPDEVLRALPERMRERILRDREQVAARAARAGVPVTAPPPPPPPVKPVKPAAPSAQEILGEDEAFDQTFEQLFGGLGPEAARVTQPTPLPVRPPAPTPPPPPRAPAPPAARAPLTLPPGMTESAGRELFQRYVQAKQAVGEPTASLKLESVLGSLARQAPQIMAKHAATGVDFQVLIRDGKVILKATPRR